MEKMCLHKSDFALKLAKQERHGLRGFLALQHKLNFPPEEFARLVFTGEGYFPSAYKASRANSSGRMRTRNGHGGRNAEDCSLVKTCIEEKALNSGLDSSHITAITNNMKKIPNKLIISGNWVEAFFYESPHFKRNDSPFIERVAHMPRPRAKWDDLNINKVRSDFSLNRTKSNIRRIVNSNTDFSKFVTLTFKENITTLSEANKYFNFFTQKLRSCFGESLKYLAIPEFQKRGAVHYHLLINIPYVKKETLAEIWGHGFVQINRIDNVKNLGSYVSKYLKKSVADSRLFGRRAYFASQNIARPEIYTSYSYAKQSDLVDVWDSICQKNPQLEHQAEYDSTYQGLIRYEQYFLE